MSNKHIKQLSNKISNLEKKIDALTSRSFMEEYVSEEEAKKVFGKGDTWFYNLRTIKGFPYYKFAGTVYYLKQDFIDLLNSNHFGHKSNEK